MKKKLIYIFSLILILIILLLSFFSLFNIDDYLQFIMFDYFGIKIILSIICLVVINQFKINKLNIGIFLITLSHIFDFIDIFIFHNINLTQTYYYLIKVILDIWGIILIIYGVVSAIDNIKNLNDRLYHLAYYDSLTNLPNINYLKSSCRFTDNHCDQCSKCNFIKTKIKKERAALLFIDIDDFKLINDYTGHAGGDFILRTTANRLKDSVTETDIVCRISGDEFLIIINNPSSLNNLDFTLKTVLHNISEVIMYKDKELHITASIGVVFYPTHGHNFEKLLKNSDIAMYEAKQLGKNSYFIFNNNLEKDFDKRFEGIYELKQAIKNQDFVVHYQPKANINNNHITGLEALIRWVHPTRGLIYPDEFIPLAEEINYIDKIDMTTLTLVAKQIAKWLNEGQTPYPISINISPQFFLNRDFITNIDTIASVYSIDFTYINFEITENIALYDIELSRRVIEQLKKRNIKISIDDFGKGYSSINYIKEFDFDYLKIDKSYIENLIHNKKEQAILDLIINLSKLYGFKVVSEGVETQAQLDILSKLGCHEYQGFLLSRPQPLETLDVEFNTKQVDH